jgi:hypothetical protein
MFAKRLSVHSHYHLTGKRAKRGLASISAGFAESDAWKP